MPETFDFSNESSKSSELDQHMAQVHQYLQKTNNGRMSTGVNPDQPAFSPVSEMLRQTGVKQGMVPADVAAQHEQGSQGAPTSYDFSQGNSNPQVYDFDSTGGSTGSSRGYAENLQRNLPDTLLPKQTRGPSSTQALDPLIQGLIAPLAAAQDTVLGGNPRELANKAFGQPSTDWKQNVLPGAMEGLLGLIPALPLMAGGLRGTPKPPTIPRPISQDQLNNLVAERAAKGEQTPPVAQVGPVSPDLGVTPAKAGQAAPVNPMVEPSLVPQAGQVSPVVTAPAGTMAKAPTAQVEPVTKSPSTQQQTLFDHPFEERAQEPLRAQMGDNGKTVEVTLAEQGVKVPGDLTVGNSLDGVAYPNMYAQVAGSVIDATRFTGPIGERIATMGDAAYSIRAMRTSQQALEATKAIDQVFGRTTLGQRIKVRAKMFSEGENAALTGERTIWGVTPAQEEQAFNHLYTNGRMPTTDPKAQGLADAVYNHLGYPASADPDVRALKGVLNPFTGKYTPFGEPGKFMPQQPIHPITADAIKDSQWRILYERKGGGKLGINLETFKSTIVKLSQHNPEVTAGKAQGLENMRLLDLEALGGSPYQWAKKLGYETDVFRAMFRYHSLATLRGQLGRIEGPINELLMSIPAKDAATAEWLSKAAAHILQKPSAAFDTTTRMTNGIKAASHLMDITLLQKGMLANVAQASYIGARGGLRATSKGMLDLLTAKDRTLIEQSGANFPALMNELTTPTGPMARWSSIAYRLYGLSMIDRNTRYFAGHVGNRFIQQIEGSFLKNPQSIRLQGLIKELGGDPQVLLQQGKLPDDMRLGMIQRFANYTSGVTDVRGLPLWASSQNPWFKLVNKYRSFAASNSGEIRRAIFNAPTAYDGTKRAVTLLLGAYGLGSGIKIVGTDLINSIMGNEPKQSRAGLWNKIEPLIYGLGTIEGMLVVNAAQDPTRAALSFTGGPLAGAAVNFADDLKATAEHGIGWRSIRAAASRLPIVGPFTGGYVKGQAKQQNATEAADRQQLAP